MRGEGYEDHPTQWIQTAACWPPVAGYQCYYQLLATGYVFQKGPAPQGPKGYPLFRSTFPHPVLVTAQSMGAPRHEGLWV